MSSEPPKFELCIVVPIDDHRVSCHAMPRDGMNHATSAARIINLTARSDSIVTFTFIFIVHLCRVNIYISIIILPSINMKTDIHTTVLTSSQKWYNTSDRGPGPAPLGRKKKTTTPAPPITSKAAGNDDCFTSPGCDIVTATARLSRLQARKNKPPKFTHKNKTK